jgi:hypothetical protein
MARAGRKYWIARASSVPSFQKRWGAFGGTEIDCPQGQRVIAQIEADWGAALGRDRFESLCSELQSLLDLLDSSTAQSYR